VVEIPMLNRFKNNRMQIQSNGTIIAIGPFVTQVFLQSFFKLYEFLKNSNVMNPSEWNGDVV
jgi:hypothetical protein